MKYLAVAVMVVLAQADGANSLVGLWEADARSHGGIGSAMEFRSDGTYTGVTTVLVDGYYRVVDDRLVIAEQPLAGDVEASAAPVLSFEGNECRLVGPGGAVLLTKERVGDAQAGMPPIVGIWHYKHPAGATAFERFTADGRVQLRIPMGSVSGRFAQSENSLVLSPEGAPEVTMEMKRDGEGLMLTDASSEVSKWQRIAAGAWYSFR